MLQLYKVTASLLLGTARAACDEELLKREGVTLCINVTRQQPFPGLQRVSGIRVPVFDDPAEDLYRYFEPCSAAIQEAVQDGGKCLVYCKNGRSRSAAICTAYLMRHRQLPLKDAFEDTHKCRTPCFYHISCSLGCEDCQTRSRTQRRILVSAAEI